MNSPSVLKQPWTPGKQKGMFSWASGPSCILLLQLSEAGRARGKHVGPLSDGSGQRAVASAVSSSPLSFSHAPPPPTAALLKAQEITMC